MAHYAKVQNKKVIKVIVAEQDFIDSYIDHIPGKWIKCSYNTIGGIHYERNEEGTAITPSADQTKALRYNFPGIGWNYDEEADAFYPNKENVFESWVLDTTTYMWKPPIEKPEGNYIWNEEDQTWDLVE